jgi:hypothetical protein
MTHDLGDTCQELSRGLREETGGGHLPATLDEVVDVAELAEGVHLGRLIIALQPDPQAVADALARIPREAAGMNPQ